MITGYQSSLEYAKTVREQTDLEAADDALGKAIVKLISTAPDLAGKLHEIQTEVVKRYLVVEEQVGAMKNVSVDLRAK